MMFEHSDGEPVLVLDEDQCWNLLEGSGHGRLVLVVNGRPDIFPLNYVTHEHSLFFRTAPGTKLAELTVNDDVAFEADEVLDTEAWSVVLHGTAAQLENSAEIAEAEQAGVQSWVPTLKEHYVRITAGEVTGRHVRLGPQRERELGEGSEVGGD